MSPFLFWGGVAEDSVMIDRSLLPRRCSVLCAVVDSRLGPATAPGGSSAHIAGRRPPVVSLHCFGCFGSASFFLLRLAQPTDATRIWRLRGTPCARSHRRRCEKHPDD